MKNLFVVAILFIVSGCAYFNATMDVLDILVPDTVVHSGKVVSVDKVENVEDVIIVKFENGASYKLPSSVCCPEVGKQGIIIERSNGNLDFKNKENGE